MKSRPSFPAISLPSWMNKGEPLTLAHASSRYWDTVYTWLTWPLAQIDPDTCAEALLNMLAYQRCITRFKNEPLPLFRLRVKHAFINAQDAGERAGFERIFQRLGIGAIQTLERQLRYDWDVILLRVNDEQLSQNNALMMNLVRQYGRTCRRYFFDVLTVSPPFLQVPGTFDNDAANYSARLMVSVKGATLTPEIITIQPGERDVLYVSVLPPDAENRAWHYQNSVPDIIDVQRAATNGLEVTGLTLGQTQLTITTEEGAHTASAVVRVRIADIVTVKMRYNSNDRPLFYVSDNELNGGFAVELDDVGTIDYRVDSTGAVYASFAEIMVGRDYLLTIKGSETCRFFGARKVNDVTEIVRVTGMRTTVESMFQSCDALIRIHSGAFGPLPRLENASYLFAYCTSLSALPRDLFANLTEITGFNCTFRDCQSLVALPDTLFKSQRKATIFASVFSGCNQLSTLPEGLFASCESAWQFMDAFSLCVKLSALPPRLFPDNGKSLSLIRTFKSCTSLISIHDETFFGAVINNLYEAFYACRALKTIPATMLDKSKNKIGSMDYAFCSSGIEDIPQGVFSNLTNASSFTGIFKACYRLKTLPDGLFSGCTSARFFDSAFEASNITHIPLRLLAGCPVATLKKAFYGCYELRSISDDLVKHQPPVTSVEGIFYQCANLKNVPDGLFADLPTLEYANEAFMRSGLVETPVNLFRGSRRLTHADSLFRESSNLERVTSGCFDDCDSLWKVSNAFNGCGGLTLVAKGVFDKALKVSNLEYAFYGCVRLQSDINAVFGREQYAVLRYFARAFAGCLKLTGDGALFISKTPGNIAPYEAFKDCTNLIDYDSLPDNWK